MGQATRMMEYLVDGAKTYRGVVELGIETDTYDVQGEITRRTDPSGVTLSDVEAALSEFRGVILQVPPMYSALKRQGKRLYELARAGVEVEREPRRVEVTDISIVDWSPPLVEVRVECGRGFYMRSLAYDLGASLGCGAYLKSLVRVKSGSFDVADSVSLREAERSFEGSDWQRVVRAPDAVVDRMRALIVGKREELHLHQGRPLAPGLKVPPARHGERRRVYTTDGGFVGIVSFDAPGRRWQPQRVLSIDYARGQREP
jgi:tRNA pseudouridine55 synthase